MNRYTLIYFVAIILTLVYSGNTLLAQEKQVKADSIAPDGTAIYRYIEQMPTPRFDLKEYLSKNIRYPQFARLKNVEGKVIVGFIITEKGNVDSVHIRQSVGSGCDEEAIRVVSNMPKWTPGRTRRESGGRWRKVKVYYTLPINFKLTD